MIKAMAWRWIAGILVGIAGWCVRGEGRGGGAGAKALGIGFLWTAQSQEAAGKLGVEGDFVDVILGEGKLGVFGAVSPPVRVACIARSLEKHASRPFPGLRETIALLRGAGIAPDRVILAYNPERQPGTPPSEMDDLVGSVRRAREMARGYGAPLLVGPGLREMGGREDLYPELAKLCDIWLIQSQRLQLDIATRDPVPVGAYREAVGRIVERLREGNSGIRVLVQVVTTSGRGKSAMTGAAVAAYAKAVGDMVDGVRIYGGSRDLLGEVIATLRGGE